MREQTMPGFIGGLLASAIGYSIIRRLQSSTDLVPQGIGKQEMYLEEQSQILKDRSHTSRGEAIEGLIADMSVPASERGETRMSARKPVVIIQAHKHRSIS